MANVYFKPYSAVKYVGAKGKVFSASLARPKPSLKKGDIIIVDKRTAHNLTVKGFGEFIEVDNIEFVKSDVATHEMIEKLKEQHKACKNENDVLFAKNVELTKELNALKTKGN